MVMYQTNVSDLIASHGRYWVQIGYQCLACDTPGFVSDYCCASDGPVNHLFEHFREAWLSDRRLKCCEAYEIEPTRYRTFVLGSVDGWRVRECHPDHMDGFSAIPGELRYVLRRVGH